MKKKVYVAGKMRGCDHYNFPAFDTAAKHLRAEGWTVINPAEMDRLYEGWGEYPPEEWEFNTEDATRMIMRDLSAITGCDAIYMLDGWEHSKGARAEIALAQFLGLEILNAGGEHRF